MQIITILGLCNEQVDRNYELRFLALAEWVAARLFNFNFQSIPVWARCPNPYLLLNDSYMSAVVLDKSLINGKCSVESTAYCDSGTNKNNTMTHLFLQEIGVVR